MSRIKVLIVTTFIFWFIFGDIARASDYSFGVSRGQDFSKDLPRNWSVDFLMRPNKTVFGVRIGNSNYVTNFKDSPVSVRSLDVTGIIGYWSNRDWFDPEDGGALCWSSDNCSLVGWHAYAGLGPSLVNFSSPDFTVTSSIASHVKGAAGLDVYLIRKPTSALVLTAEAMLTSTTLTVRPLNNQNELDRLYPMQLVWLVGFRYWY